MHSETKYRISELIDLFLELYEEEKDLIENNINKTIHAHFNMFKRDGRFFTNCVTFFITKKTSYFSNCESLKMY